MIASQTDYNSPANKPINLNIVLMSSVCRQVPRCLVWPLHHSVLSEVSFIGKRLFNSIKQKAFEWEKLQEQRHPGKIIK